MAKVDQANKFKQKWWLHPMDPENLVELGENDQRNAKRFNHWLLIWGLMFFGIALGIDPLPGGMDATPVWRILLVFSPLIPCIFLIHSFIRLFNETRDELIKKIHYESLAVGFSLAFFIGMCFALSESILGDSNKAAPLMFASLLVGYFVGIFFRYRKYNA